MTPRSPNGGYRCRVDRITQFLRVWWVETTAVVLALAGAVEGLASATVDGVSRGPGWLLPFEVALMALPLLFVKRFPFAAPVATVLIGIGISVATTGKAVTGAFVAILLLNLAAWLFGRLDRRSAVVGLLLIYAAVIVVDTQADELTAADVGFPWFLFTLFWGASVFVTSREGHAREAEERAQRIAIEQERASLQAVAEERQRIARELHDVIAHSVSVMTVQAGAVRRLLLPEQERERQALEIVESTGREALTEMRRLVGLLREHGTMPEFAPQPSLRTLDILIGTVREAGLEVELDVQGQERELPPGVDLSAYRLVQEALTNTLKYAGPAQAWVTLRWRDDELELEVANNGHSEAASNGTGHGLAGMRERVALCGGTLETGPRDGGGFVVRCHLPLGSAI
jgi:signal transduction histidine kinase